MNFKIWLKIQVVRGSLFINMSIRCSVLKNQFIISLVLKMFIFNAKIFFFKY